MKIKFKMALFAFIISTVLFGCFNESQSIENLGKDQGFRLEFLFEKDGIKVYRFWDGGRAHYFTTQGETISSQSDDKSDHDETIKQQKSTGIEYKF
jgi:hypothetical protein